MRRQPVVIGVQLAFTAAILGTAQTPAPSPQPGGRNLLVGQVVEAGSTTPVASAVVTLGGAATGTGNSVIFSFSQPVIPGGNRQVITDAQGHFVFAQVPDGAYTLQATKPGYSPGGFGKRRATGWPQPIVVAGTTGVADLTIPIFKFATMSGTVIDEAGEPIVGIRVRAMRRIYENGRPQFATALAGMTADTDDRGMFRFTTLIPGEYLVGFPSTQSTVPQSLVEAYRRATSSGAGGEFTSELLRSGLSMLDMPSPSSPGVPVGNQLFATTNSGSRALPPPPPTGDARLLVYPFFFHPSTTNPAQSTLITLAAGEDRVGVDLHLKPVLAGRLSGTIAGPAGPMPHTPLTLIAAASNFLTDQFLPVATTVSDATGAFVFLGVPTGQYVLQALIVPRQTAPSAMQTTIVQTGSGSTSMTSAADAMAPAVRPIPEGPTLWAQLPVAVEEPERKPVTVVLRTGFRIAGQLRFDGAAKPPADAFRRIVATLEPLDDRSSANTTVRRLTINAAGSITSYELPPGRYMLRVQGTIPGWALKSATAGGRDISVVPFDLQDASVNVVMTYTDRRAVLRGVVRTAKGSPDTGAQIMAFPIDVTSPAFEPSLRRLRSTRATTTGTYELSGLPPGEYFVVAAADDASADFPSLALIRTLARSATRVKIGETGDVTQDLTTVTGR
jgi:hypothetical protein